MSTNYVEIDRDEMEYVDGGYLVGKFSSTNSAGVKYLRDQAIGWGIGAGLYAAVAALSTVAAVLSSPSIVGGIIFGILALGSGIVSSYGVSLCLSALQSMKSAQRLMKSGKSYSVYCDTVGGVVIGYATC